jgi:hypothetical protein
MLIDHLFNKVQSNAGTTGGLGGKKQIKNLFASVFGDA